MRSRHRIRARIKYIFCISLLGDLIMGLHLNWLQWSYHECVMWSSMRNVSSSFCVTVFLFITLLYNK